MILNGTEMRPIAKKHISKDQSSRLSQCMFVWPENVALLPLWQFSSIQNQTLGFLWIRSSVAL